jgi:hypothetical protein
MEVVAMRVTPSTIIAGAALFFALGGSAVAVTEAVRPQARCQPGAVRGYIAVNGDPSKGIANIGDAFTSARPLVGARFNCAGAAPQARRVNTGVYEVRFPGNTGPIAVATSAGAETTVAAVGGSTFRISLWVPGRQDAVDTPFSVVLV